MGACWGCGALRRLPRIPEGAVGAPHGISRGTFPSTFPRTIPVTSTVTPTARHRAGGIGLEAHTERERPLVVLIGGATGAGKTTVAEGLAAKLGTPRVVTTDAVREVLRGVLSPAGHPELHCSTFETGDLPAFADAEDPVIAGFLAQVRLVSAGTASLLARALVEATDTIVEGVHLVPGAHHLQDELEATVVPLIITVDDVETHRSFIEARATSDRPPDRYLRNLDRIRRIQDEIVRRAQEHEVPRVSSRTPQQAVADALAVVETGTPVRS